MKGFYQICACRPSWSCDLDHLCKLSLLFPRRLHIYLALIDQAVPEEKIFENGGRTTDGRRLDGYTISSPCEPNGSGELKMLTIIGILTFMSRINFRLGGIEHENILGIMAPGIELSPVLTYGTRSAKTEAIGTMFIASLV